MNLLLLFPEDFVSDTRARVEGRRLQEIRRIGSDELRVGVVNGRVGTAKVVNGELVQSLKTSKRFGASLRLLKPQDRVRKTLRLTNLLPMFNLYETEADALKGFATET